MCFVLPESPPEIRVAGAGLRAARGLEVLSIDFQFAGHRGSVTA